MGRLANVDCRASWRVGFSVTHPRRRAGALSQALPTVPNPEGSPRPMSTLDATLPGRTAWPPIPWRPRPSWRLIVVTSGHIINHHRTSLGANQPGDDLCASRPWNVLCVGDIGHLSYFFSVAVSRRSEGVSISRRPHVDAPRGVGILRSNEYSDIVVSASPSSVAASKALTSAKASKPLKANAPTSRLRVRRRTFDETNTSPQSHLT